MPILGGWTSIWWHRARGPVLHAGFRVGRALSWYMSCSPHPQSSSTLVTSRSTLKAPRPQLGGTQWLSLVTFPCGVLAWGQSLTESISAHLSLTCPLFSLCFPHFLPDVTARKDFRDHPVQQGYFTEKAEGEAGRTAGTLACDPVGGSPHSPVCHPLASLMPPLD